jgi:23S rRNA (uracil1939-C5)-methyltransferase
MEFSFGDSRWLSAEEIASKQQIDRSFALGLHIPGRFDKVLDVEECFLPPPTAIIILNAVREAAKARSCSVFQTRTHEGFLRNLVLRTSRATKELMVILVTSPPRTEEEHDMIRWFSDEFTRLVPAVTTTVHAVSHSKASLALGEPHVLHGSGRITEELLGIRFEVSPFSFFQTNSAQAEQLFSTALQFAGLSKSVIAWDLYCGAGSITLPAARQAKHVVGIELSESSIADARRNALLNGITNVAFYAEDMYKAATTQLLLTLPQPDVVIVDPPRAGMHAEVVQMLRRVAPPVIVYVSCNPATQARDCALLAAKSPAELSASEHSSARYIVEQVQPVDMFPHTYHIESVARLVRVQE